MDYDPYKHRENANLTFFDALMSILKVVFGTGILAMPISYQKTGYAAGILTTSIVVFVMTYAIHILIRCMIETCRRHQVPYLPLDKSIVLGFMEGPEQIQPLRYIFEFFVTFLMLCFYVGIGTAYIVFLAQGINKILEQYATPIDIRVLIMLVTIPLSIIYMIRNLKALVPYSTFANILSFIAYISIIVIIVQGLPPLSDRRPFNSLDGVPFCIGTVLFASNSLGVFLSVESQMIEPWKYISFFGILNISMFLNFVVLCVFAFFGYWKYGDNILGSITLNVAEESTQAQSINIFLLISIYITFAVQCSVIIDIVWHQGFASRFAEETRVFYETILRIVTVIVLALLGIIVPEFDVILSIVGNAVVTIISICLPAIFDLCLRYKTGYGFMYIYMFRDILLIIFGLGAFVKGFSI